MNTSITSIRLVRIFEQLQRDHGLPQTLRTDNGPEFLGETFVQWAQDHGMAIQYIQPGKPNQNAYIERFNRTFREEILDPYLFLRVDDLRQAAYWWMIEYNERRPHDSLGGKTPSEVRQQHTSGSTLRLSAWGGRLRLRFQNRRFTPLMVDTRTALVERLTGIGTRKPSRVWKGIENALGPL